jgi:pimeloyl-ACP methyl ester carboxylesterase
MVEQVPIALTTPTGKIYGTLTLPLQGRSPAALLIAGSGPTDRNGNSAILPGRNDSHRMLAEGLAERGVASLRYDKRGIGQSKAAMSSEADLRFDDYVSDAEGWIRKLLHDERFSGVGVIGHSEGSLVGMLAAAGTEAGAFVSLAGAGEPADELIRRQLASLPDGSRGPAEQILTALKQGRTVADIDQSLHILFRPSVQPYLVSWFRYDPAAALGKLTIPVLIVQGSADLQVSVDEAQILHRARPEAGLLILEGMNHVLKRVGTEVAENRASYSDPSLPVDERLVEAVGDFLLRHLR